MDELDGKVAMPGPWLVERCDCALDRAAGRTAALLLDRASSKWWLLPPSIESKGFSSQSCCCWGCEDDASGASWPPNALPKSANDETGGAAVDIAKLLTLLV